MRSYFVRHRLFQERREEFKRIVDQCADCGTNIICTETGRDFIDRDTDQRAWELLADSLWEICDYAQDNNCVVAIEMGRSDLIFGVNYFRKLQKMINKNNLKINLDPANLLLGKLDPVATARELIDDIVQVHLKDADTTMRPLGDGAVDFKNLVSLLEKNGYTGNYIIESEYPAKNPSDGVSHDYSTAVKLLCN